MLNPNLTKEQAVWLIETFAPRMGGMVNGKTMETIFMPARELIQGFPTERPGCGCHFVAYAKMTASMYGQHYDQIKVIAYENEIQKTKKRGRKKKLS